MPTIMPPVVVGTVWVFLFHPYGLLNQGLEGIGLPAIPLADRCDGGDSGVHPLRVKWRSIPFFMIIFLAGLQNIPLELKEAAKMDGASKLESLWYVTMPMLTANDTPGDDRLAGGSVPELYERVHHDRRRPRWRVDHSWALHLPSGVRAVSHGSGELRVGVASSSRLWV